MKTFQYKVGVNDTVHFYVDGYKHRMCTITAVKFEEDCTKLDLKSISGQKFFDVNENNIQTLEEESTLISQNELTNV